MVNGDLRIDANHNYTLGGQQWLPGVTRILADSGYYSGSEFFTEESRIRGKQAHLATQLADQHCPDRLTVEEVLEVIEIAEPLIPYLEGYLLFRRETGYRADWNERLWHLKSPLVAGTIDSFGKYRTGRRVLVDLKSWKSQGVRPKPSAEIQTGGYSLMVKQTTGLEVDVRVILALPGNGKYRAYEVTDHSDEFIFQCTAHSWWHRYNKGLIKRGGESEVELAA